MAHDDDFDPFIAEIARELRAPVSIDARFDERVMAAPGPAVLPIPLDRSARPVDRRPFTVSRTCSKRGFRTRPPGAPPAGGPPLIIERGQIDQIVDTLRTAIRRAA